MATNTRVTEPAAAVDVVTATEPVSIPDNVPGVEYDPRKLVYVYDIETGEKQPNPVPETWLDGRFPRLKEIPSASTKKAGK